MNILKKHWASVILSFLVILSIGLFFFKINRVPRCLNADEASVAYNAYSILKTGADEYGKFLPLRLKAFGDNRLPLLTYLDIPWVATLGLNETAARMANFPFVILFPVVVFFLAKELFNNKLAGVMAATFAAFSVGLQSLGRQTHEAYATAFLVTLATYFFLRFVKKQNTSGFLFFIITFSLALFGYHSTRLWAGFYFLTLLYFVVRKKIGLKYLLVFFGVLLAFAVTDLVYTPSRVSNLLFFNNEGFQAKVYELRIEGGLRFIYNKATVGARDLINEYSKYFSPQFLAINGDDNYRFGYPGMSPITMVEYGLIFVGFYFLFKTKEKWRFFLAALFLFSPTSAILSWAGTSVTRSLFIFIPASLIAGYAVAEVAKKNKLWFAAILGLYLVLAIYGWDFYLNHFPQRAIVVRAWQCGYKELADYVKTNYNRFDRFYITRKNGQPYIFLLFYLNYPPALYQKQAKLSAPDEYGFGQVEEFDKFKFSVTPTVADQNVAVVGYPDDFPSNITPEEKQLIKVIKVGTEEMFWIKEIVRQP